MVQQDRATGVLLDLACGDALGCPVEGWTAEQIEAEHRTLRDFVGYGGYEHPPGTVTDDTQFPTRLARSLVECREFDRDDFVVHRIERHLHRGNADAFDEQIERIIDRLEGDDFADWFKGVFQQEALPEGRAIDELTSFLRRQWD